MERKQKQATLNEIYEKGLNMIKSHDIAHKAFLRPMQIQLKKQKLKGLAIGLEQQIKNKLYPIPSRLQLHNIHLDELEEQKGNSLLSALKKKQGLELAVCVCMYSQDKKSLKTTIKGIEENIDCLVRKNINPDDIAVFIIMDGIEKIDSSIIQYFNELEKQSGIHFDDRVYNKDQILYQQETDNKEQMKSIFSFLVSEDQFQQRVNLRFKNLHEEYNQIKKLQKEIKNLKSKNTTYQDLPSKIKKIFLAEARKMKARQYGISEDQCKQNSDALIQKQYAQNLLKARPLIRKALDIGGSMCEQYFSQRSSLSYLAQFRKKVRVNNFDTPQNKRYIKDQLEYDRISWPQTYMNLFICVKYQNGGKLSSHNWFFNGFCRQLRPKFGVLLDVGLRPGPNALYKMFFHMKQNPNVGGVCGYMHLNIEKVNEKQEIKSEEIDCFSSLMLKLVDIQRTQQVQYHFAHIIDKAFQSAYGFIHVLPGAFSAYNITKMFGWDSDKKEDNTLLQEYFKSIEDKLANNKILSTEITWGNAVARVLLPEAIYNCFFPIQQFSEEQMLYNENIYLAQDRILCMGIHKKGLSMSFLPDAQAEVDPIQTMHSLFGQRKRWINGSTFAFNKVKQELSKHQQQKNTCEVGLRIQMYYLTLMNALGFFSPSFFMFTIHIAMEAFRSDLLIYFLPSVFAPTSPFYSAFVYSVDFFYTICIVTMIFLSLHLKNTHKDFKFYGYLISSILGLFSIIISIILFVDIFRGFINNSQFFQLNNTEKLPGGQVLIFSLRIIIICTLGLYVVALFAYFLRYRKIKVVFEIIFGAFSALFYGPTYLILLNIYALCRIDDISWGTKGLDSKNNSVGQSIQHTWKIIKYLHVFKYLMWNIIFGAILISVGSTYVTRFFFTFCIVIFLTVCLFFKIIIAVFYLFCLSSTEKEPQFLQVIPQSTLQPLFRTKDTTIEQIRAKSVVRPDQEIYSSTQLKRFKYQDRNFSSDFSLSQKKIKIQGLQEQNDLNSLNYDNMKESQWSKDLKAVFSEKIKVQDFGEIMKENALSGGNQNITISKILKLKARKDQVISASKIIKKAPNIIAQKQLIPIIRPELKESLSVIQEEAYSSKKISTSEKHSQYQTSKDQDSGSRQNINSVIKFQVKNNLEEDNKEQEGKKNYKKNSKKEIK